MPTLVDCVEMAYESVPKYQNEATAVSTTKRYFPVQECQLVPSPAYLDRGDELRGWEADPKQLIETYDPVGTLRMRGYVDDLTWLLGLAGFTGVFTAGNGIITDPEGATIPAGANRWVFSKRGGLIPRTAEITACYVDEAVFLRENGCALSQLGITADGDISADISGLWFQNLAADPNIVPTLPSANIPHMRRGDLAVTWLAGSGNTEDFSLSISNPLAKRRSMEVRSFFPDKMEHDTEKVRVTGSIPKSTLKDADIDALLAGTSFVAKAFWQQEQVIGATAKKYSVWVEMPAVQLLSGSPEGLSNKRRHGGSYEFKAAYDETAGYDVKITLVNAVTAISSVGN